MNSPTSTFTCLEFFRENNEHTGDFIEGLVACHELTRCHDSSYTSFTSLLYQPVVPGFLSYLTLYRFLKELHHMNLLIQEYIPAWDCSNSRCLLPQYSLLSFFKNTLALLRYSFDLPLLPASTSKAQS